MNTLQLFYYNHQRFLHALLNLYTGPALGVYMATVYLMYKGQTTGSFLRDQVVAMASGLLWPVVFLVKLK